MRKRPDEPYQLGNAIEYNEEEELSDLMHFDKNQHTPKERKNGFRIGTIGKATKTMEEGEDVGSIVDMSDEQIRNAAMEEFANKIKNAVSAKLMGKKINLKLKGNKELVQQVAEMIKLEAEYLNALISGQAADTPFLQKNKETLKTQAKKLDRMLQTDDFWPFK